MSTMQFLVSTDQLHSQLAEGSAFDHDHQLWQDQAMRVITDDGARSAQQVMWFLLTGNWSEVFTTCGQSTCIRHDHLTDSAAQASAVRDEEELALVERSAVSLADLYRRGKAKGLLTARTEYHNKP
jgi:hypothetical protein